MGFGDFAREVKKAVPVKKMPSVEQNDMVDALAETKSPKQEAKKQDISYRDSEIQGFVPMGRSNSSRQSVDTRHGSIIRNIASASNTNSQSGGEVSWEECKHKKSSMGKDYCAEFHSLCAKNNCRRARR